uniref:peptide chain release factor family protein n=1 Tax=Cephaloticoccus sp. TaxID=1985742 RepID=UPI00404A11F4
MQFPTQIDRRMITLGLRVEDVDERFVKGTGAGGQKINKTSSTVWLRHRPSGVEVRCQAGRSQAANREQAWGELCDKLEAIRRDAKLAVKQEKETERRRTRQKSPRQKARMVDAKKHRSRHKAHRGRVRDHD